MESCDHVAQFNIAGTAGLYSTLTGVLAGFAFTALIVLVTFRLQTPDAQIQPRFAHSAQLLVAAFLGLTLTSLGYAALSGEPLAVAQGISQGGAGGRAASAELLLGVGFAACGILLIYAIVHTLDAADAASAVGSERPMTVIATHLRKFAALVMIPLLVAFLFLAAQDYQQTYYGSFHLSRWLNVLGAILIVSQFAVGCVLWWREPKTPRTHAGERKLVAYFAYGLLSLVVAAVVAFTALTAVLKACDALPPSAVVGILAIFSLAAMLSAYVFARSPLQSGL